MLGEIRAPDQAAIERELTEIRDSFEDEGGGWRDLLEPAVKAALVVGVGLAILQQVTGINTVIYYAPTIIEFTGVDSSSSAILASMGVGVVNIVMTIVALRLIDRRGRRPLLIVGLIGMIASLIALGGAFVGDDASTLVSVIAIASLMSYVAAFAISLGPIFWLLNSELYPVRVRNRAAVSGDDGQLGRELRRLAHLPAPDRRARPLGRVLVLRRDRRAHALVLLEARARDQGQAAGGDRGGLQAARRREPPNAARRL